MIRQGKLLRLRTENTKLNKLNSVNSQFRKILFANHWSSAFLGSILDVLFKQKKLIFTQSKKFGKKEIQFFFLDFETTKFSFNLIA